mmetsp:Transcript_136140/g.423003  ORF Transcript_136140/g.423003 Transcript_136140/m.423003 type:complete len:451 (+) Transcript_136140:504-1856(+)
MGRGIQRRPDVVEGLPAHHAPLDVLGVPLQHHDMVVALHSAPGLHHEIVLVAGHVRQLPLQKRALLLDGVRVVEHGARVEHVDGVDAALVARHGLRAEREEGAGSQLLPINALLEPLPRHGRGLLHLLPEVVHKLVGEPVLLDVLPHPPVNGVTHKVAELLRLGARVVQVPLQTTDEVLADLLHSPLNLRLPGLVERLGHVGHELVVALGPPPVDVQRRHEASLEHNFVRVAEPRALRVEEERAGGELLPIDGLFKHLARHGGVGLAHPPDPVEDLIVQPAAGDPLAEVVQCRARLRGRVGEVVLGKDKGLHLTIHKLLNAALDEAVDVVPPSLNQLLAHVGGEFLVANVPLVHDADSRLQAVLEDDKVAVWAGLIECQFQVRAGTQQVAGHKVRLAASHEVCSHLQHGGLVEVHAAAGNEEREHEAQHTPRHGRSRGSWSKGVRDEVVQ